MGHGGQVLPGGGGLTRRVLACSRLHNCVGLRESYDQAERAEGALPGEWRHVAIVDAPLPCFSAQGLAERCLA